MSVTSDIVATYRGPAQVVRRRLSQGVREDRALVILVLGCGLIFVAQMPRLARQAHLTGEDLNMLMGGALLGWLFIAPLMFYLLAGISHLVMRAFGGQGSGYGARFALFWALLASGPLALLYGLMAGFAGPGAGLNLVGLVWMAVFLWFWGAGLRAAQRPGS